MIVESGPGGHLLVVNNLADVLNAVQALKNLGGLASANNLSDVASTVTALTNLGGLAATNNLSDVANRTTALTNLGVLDANGAQIGGMVAHTTGPPSTTNFSANSAVCSVTAPVIVGEKYKIDAALSVGTQNTSTAIVIISFSTDDSVVNARRWVSDTLTAGTEMSGAGHTVYVPASSRTTTFSCSCSSSAGTFTIGAGLVEMTVTRVV